MTSPMTTTTEHPRPASGLTYNPYAPRNLWNRAMNLLVTLFSTIAVLPPGRRDSVCALQGGRSHHPCHLHGATATTGIV